jgi:hypothetical protein
MMQFMLVSYKFFYMDGENNSTFTYWFIHRHNLVMLLLTSNPHRLNFVFMQLQI